jgi:hypothetical protein
VVVIAVIAVETAAVMAAPSSGRPRQKQHLPQE